MSLLTMVQQVTRRIGIAAPSAVAGNTDEQIIQVLALANEEGEELAERHTWQSMTKEVTFVTGGDAKTITAVTKANPAVVTANSHGYSTGDQVDIADVEGMVQINNLRFTITRVNANTFSLDDTDSSNYGTYSTGGKSRLVQASQGTISTIISAGDFDASAVRITNETMWNRTQRRPVFGPLTARAYQALQASPVTGPFDQYRFRGNELIFDPAPTGFETIAFEYISNHWGQSSGGTTQDAWAADTDIGRISEKIMATGIIWRWKQAKGLAYAEDYNKYERRVADAVAREATKPVLDLAGGLAEYQPGLFVPQGNWNIS